MRGFRVALLAFVFVMGAAVISYFLSMYIGGGARISSNTQDWGGFGSFIGGILAPAASLLAGYMVYKSFTATAYQQKLSLARETLSRLDVELEKRLEAPFNNSCFGIEYHGRPFRRIVNALSNNEIEATEVSNKMILALLHNIAILTNSVRYYLGLLDGLPTAEKDNQWLGDLEKCYWVEKYSAVCSRMIRIVGDGAFEGKVGEELVRSFKIVLGGWDGR
ncbi:hypothetical protein [Pseudomonas brassicacearum]|uniref:DUF4760 domain-containing protein n=1 Tax=Pseudomonas brassicacearum TaxID=930166 RepID=A0AAJ3FWW6_9PSED|nr:hypothetical protein [Pseudomonas brassicacearum]NUT82437.1 hypothetical protein [Pseudomonas brassicacearum]